MITYQENKKSKSVSIKNGLGFQMGDFNLRFLASDDFKTPPPRDDVKENSNPQVSPVSPRSGGKGVLLFLGFLRAFFTSSSP